MRRRRSELQAADAVRRQLEAMQSDYNYILYEEIHVSKRGARARRGDAHAPRRYLAHPVRAEDGRAGQGSAARPPISAASPDNAGKLIALLEDSKLVEQAAPRSPTTKIQGGTGEIFDVSARLRVLPPPPAQPSAIASAPTAPARPRNRRARHRPPRRPRSGQTQPLHPSLLSRRPRFRPRQPPAPAAPAAAPVAAPAPSAPRAPRAAADMPAVAADEGVNAAPAFVRRRERPRLRPATPPAQPPARPQHAHGSAGSCTAGARAGHPSRRRRHRMARPRRTTTDGHLRASSRTEAEPRACGGLARASPSCWRLALLLAPFLLLHRHYDVAIEALQDRIETYRRASRRKRRAEEGARCAACQDGRRFFLRNTAPNLAGAELQDLVRAAIENNGGRITTIQTAQPREDGRFRQIRHQRAAVRDHAEPAEDRLRARNADAVMR